MAWEMVVTYRDFSIKEKRDTEKTSISLNRVQCEPSGMAGLSLLLQLRKKIPKEKKILIVNTGKTKYPMPILEIDRGGLTNASNLH